MTLIVGDVHGKHEKYMKLVEGVEGSIQVGDFGVGFCPPNRLGTVERFQKDENHRFIRGNHDNPALCREMDTWIEDGHVEDDFMFVGGAWSIDHSWRTAGVDWWHDEELSVREFDQLIDRYANEKPRIMITHDCPIVTAENLAFDCPSNIIGGIRQTRTGQALQSMFEFHQPDFWFFGHWHVDWEKTLEGTQFVCLAELSRFNL